MRYTVEVQGETYQVDVRQGSQGPEVAVGDGSHQPARLRPVPAPLHTLELGSQRHRLVVGADAYEAGVFDVALEGCRSVRVSAADERTLAASNGRKAGASRSVKTVRAAMPGVIYEVSVGEGDAVTKGQILLVLEAMKMQNEISAVGDAVVEKIHVKAGDAVAAGDKLVEFAD